MTVGEAGETVDRQGNLEFTFCFKCFTCFLRATTSESTLVAGVSSKWVCRFSFCTTLPCVESAANSDFTCLILALKFCISECLLSS